MIDGHATLSELLHAPPDRVFRERRLLRDGAARGLRLDGTTLRSEYRANATIARMQARILELEMQARLEALGIGPTP